MIEIILLRLVSVVILGLAANLDIRLVQAMKRLAFRARILAKTHQGSTPRFEKWRQSLEKPCHLSRPLWRMMGKIPLLSDRMRTHEDP